MSNPTKPAEVQQGLPIEALYEVHGETHFVLKLQERQLRVMADQIEKLKAEVAELKADGKKMA